MAHISEHILDSERLLGNKYTEVHIFLDKYAEIFPPAKFGEYHRSFLHNTYGIEVAGYKWGVEGKKTAIIHLIRDYIEMPVKSFAVVDQYFNRAIKYFNNLANFDVEFPPHVIRAWGGNGLVTIAMEE